MEDFGVEFPTYSFGLGDYTPSYYDYIQSYECTGFGLNLINSTDIKIHNHLNSFLSRIILLVIQPLVAVLGALGNLIFIFSVWKLPSTRNSINLILLNLSFADLLYLLVGTAEKFVKAIKSPVREDSLIFGQIFQCFIILPFLNAVSFASLLLVSLVSVERYVAVCKPIQHLKITSRRRTSAYIIFIWVCCFSLAICLLPSSMNFVTFCIKWPDIPTYTHFPIKVGYCQARSDLWASARESTRTFPYFFALLLNVVCTAKIVFRLYKRRDFPSSLGGMQNNHTVTRHKNSANAATKMLLINGIAYFLLATPFHVVNIIQFMELVFPT
ncbi:Neuromedin-U receptor 2 [Holothuria leucospilota]|uniref:Neuromedin-U receptor 2 n=1 Tax=Holothuria leucospilota TaxID=206669 RepID=A0A9Q1GWW5_HOLLE|nr:Neuromedin-U receptor 2 [Holothuria leucospilota]